MRRTKPRSADAITASARRPDSTAVFRIKGERVPFAKLAPEVRLQEGDFVMALGAPWGLNRSVSFGIISCARRYLPESSEYHVWLQTDASISPGNSGGNRRARRRASAPTQGGKLGVDGLVAPATSRLPTQHLF
ncbi:MAG: trypsin-like peptidase domain-containing protein [Puniceicoccales bacterium]|nr:trypsin-like peptidase domain-containing protein [Puniceicoccales bacterium]